MKRAFLVLALLHATVHAAFEQAGPDLFVWQSTCNSYVLRDGEAALLFDLGDGSVLEHLGEIGVKKVEWLLLTGHHRELLQGASRLARAITQIAAPKEEQELFENPTQFRKWNPRLGDKYSVHGSSYVRPPSQPMKVNRWLVADDVFEWHGRQIRCLATPGHSPGGMSYLLGDKAFIGGVMHDGAKMTNWFDTEWDYGFAKGLDALIATVDKLIAQAPKTAFSAQGPVIADATAQLKSYLAKLSDFRPDYIRGYPVGDLSKRGPHPATRPTKRTTSSR